MRAYCSGGRMESGLLETDDLVVQRLRAIAQDSPDLREAALFYQAILPVLREADIGAVPVRLTRDQVRKKIETGLPLLQGLDLEVDVQKVFDLMVELTVALEEGGEKVDLRKERQRDGEADYCASLSEAARRFRIALERNKLGVDVLLSRDTNSIRSHDPGFAPSFLNIFVQNALKPAYRAWCRQLIPLMEGLEWQWDFCFVCGAVPALGELQGNEQAKHLRCGQCGADWTFRRLRCIYCGNEDHRTLGYLYVEGGRKEIRVEVCDRCRGYLKVIAAFSPTPSELLSVEDFATLHMDYAAQARGYWRIPKH